jgi:hypothetical protein
MSDWEKQFETPEEKARAILELKQAYEKLDETEKINLTENQKDFINSLYNDINDLDEKELENKLNMAKEIFGEDSD